MPDHPVIDGGLFALNDTISPERYAAVYCSGVSAYWDAVGLSEIGKDIGVVADPVRPGSRVSLVLRDHLRKGLGLFVDFELHT